MNALQLSDFNYYWLAGTVALHGGNPYDVQQMQHAATLHFGATIASWQMNYPPYTLWLFMAFALLPIETSKAAWLSLMVATFVIAVWSCSSELRRRDISQSIPALLIVPALFVPLWDELRWGNANFVCLAGLCAFQWLTVRRRHFVAGVALSLAFLKPHLFLPIAIVMLIDAWRKRRIGSVSGIAFGFLVQCAVVALLAPTTYAAFITQVSTISSFTTQVGVGHTICLTGLSKYWNPQGSGWLTICLLALAVVITVMYVRKTTATLSAATVAVVPLGVITAPHGFPHAMVSGLFSHLAVWSAPAARYRYGWMTCWYRCVSTVTAAMFLGGCVFGNVDSLYRAMIALLQLQFVILATCALTERTPEREQI